MTKLIKKKKPLDIFFSSIAADNIKTDKRWSCRLVVTLREGLVVVPTMSRQKHRLLKTIQRYLLRRRAANLEHIPSSC